MEASKSKKTKNQTDQNEKLLPNKIITVYPKKYLYYLNQSNFSPYIFIVALKWLKENF